MPTAWDLGCVQDGPSAIVGTQGFGAGGFLVLGSAGVRTAPSPFTPSVAGLAVGEEDVQCSWREGHETSHRLQAMSSE